MLFFGGLLAFALIFGAPDKKVHDYATETNHEATRACGEGKFDLHEKAVIDIDGNAKYWTCKIDVPAVTQ